MTSHDFANPKGDQWWRDAITGALSSPILRAAPLSGGCVGEVLGVELADGRRVVAKLDRSSSPSLGIEARSLATLSERGGLPTPRVLLSQDRLLVSEFIPSGSGLTARGERHAAELLAALHAAIPDPPNAARFGFETDTLIAGLPQPNPWTDSWVEFFAENRLRHMARLACDAGSLPPELRSRIDRLCDRLGEWLSEPPAPSLIHGDVWSGNVLARLDGEGVGAFIDPAIFYAHAELELAFTTLFSTFSDAFYARYSEIRPIEPGFFELRRDLYNLYPLLVHVRLFGAGYLPGIERTLARQLG